jgi:hypothetical protein
MGTTRRDEGERERGREGVKIQSLPPSLSLFLALSLPLFLLAACIPTRPVVKIGLVAPFEGIYRQIGYEALAAMRVAIEESETGAFEVIPLALDSGTEPAQARRTMQKLLVDPSVRAVVGPFSPDSAVAVADLLDPHTNGWFLPFLPSTTEDREHALVALIAAIAAQTGGDSESPLVLAGWSTGWPDLSAAAWSEQVGRPVRLSSDAADVAATETIVWLGNAADGASYLSQLRSYRPDVPFWLVVGGEPSIFYQLVTHRLEMFSSPPPLGPVYWAAWLDDGYEGWAATHTPSSPTAYAVYQATQTAIAEIAGDPFVSSGPRLYVFQMTENGQFLPLNGTWSMLE